MNIKTSVQKSVDIFMLFSFVSMLLCAISSGGFLWYNCIISSAILLFLLIWNLKNLYCSINDFFLLGLLALGIISVLTTEADKQTVVYEFEKIICLVLAVGIGRLLKKERVVNMIILLAVITALCGILAYCNILHINGWFFNDRGVNRLQSFIQYANTTAVVLGMGYFLSLDKIRDDKRILGVSGVILIAFYLTLSKAAIPVFIFVGSILIMKAKQYAAQFIRQNVLCILMSIPIIWTCNRHMYILGLLLIVLTIFLNVKVIGMFIDKKWIHVWLSMIVLLIIIGFAATLIYRNTLLSTLIKRVDYMKDAVKLLKEHWVWGIGPGAWDEYQYMIQSTQYSVKYVHNSFLQFLLDYGIFFFVILVALFINVIYSVKKTRNYVVMAALAILLLHALIDFDFSFGIVLTIVGLIIGGCCEDENGFLPSARIVVIINLFICCLLIIYMSMEYIVRYNFEQSIITNEYEEARINAMLLEKLCPYDSKLQITLADLNVGDSQSRYERAIKTAPNNKEILGSYIIFSVKNDDNDILQLCKAYIELAPKQEKTYMNASQYIKDAFKEGRCTVEQYNIFCQYIADKMKEEDVVNRNELLEQIIAN